MMRFKNFTPYFKSTTTIVTTKHPPSSRNPIVTPQQLIYVQNRIPTTTNELFKSLPLNKLSITSGPVVTMQMRYAHTDLKIPDFTRYRRSCCKDPTSQNTADQRRLFTYFLSGIYSLGFLYGTKAQLLEYVLFMAPSKEVLALAKIEIKLSDIPEGLTGVYKWRGKPLFVKHRTPEEINRERNTDLAILRDPETDEQRCPVDPTWLVVIGVCTHLGCIPLANQGDFPGGWYCPCHGSHFDAAGRCRKGPAPTNLEVPEYKIQDDLVIVG